MLVLARREDEEVSMNGGQIMIRVVEVKGGRVKLAITAPKNMPIYRGEVWSTLRQEGRLEENQCAGQRHSL